MYLQTTMTTFRLLYLLFTAQQIFAFPMPSLNPMHRRQDPTTPAIASPAGPDTAAPVVLGQQPATNPQPATDPQIAPAPALAAQPVTQPATDPQPVVDSFPAPVAQPTTEQQPASDSPLPAVSQPVVQPAGSGSGDAQPASDLGSSGKLVNPSAYNVLIVVSQGCHFPMRARAPSVRQVMTLLYQVKGLARILGVESLKQVSQQEVKEDLEAGEREAHKVE